MAHSYLISSFLAPGLNRRKDKRHRKSRMDARTRERLPVLPVLARSTARHRRDAEARRQHQSFLRTGNRNVDATLIGSKWTSLNLTYSFPTSGSNYSGATFDSNGVSNYHIVLGAQQQAAAVAAARSSRGRGARPASRPLRGSPRRSTESTRAGPTFS